MTQRKRANDQIYLTMVKARLLDQRVTFWCVNYLYTGTVAEVNSECVRLTDAAVVYETGVFSEANWKDAQTLPHDIYIMRSAIEAFGVLK